MRIQRILPHCILMQVNQRREQRNQRKKEKNKKINNKVCIMNGAPHR